NSVQRCLRAVLAGAGLAVPVPSQSTSRVSVDSNGVPGEWHSEGFPSISNDGQRIAFSSEAENLAPGGTLHKQVFVHDRRTGATVLASANDAGEFSHALYNNNPSISADGRYVAFDSDATNLVAGWNGPRAIFVRDLQAGHTIVIRPGTSPR